MTTQSPRERALVVMNESFRTAHSTVQRYIAEGRPQSTGSAELATLHLVTRSPVIWAGRRSPRLTASPCRRTRLCARRGEAIGISRQLKLEQDTIPLEGRGRDSLSRKMATHRNFLAHLDSGRDQPPPEEMYETGAHTTTLVKLMILRELGLPAESRRGICENRQWPRRAGRPAT